MLQNIFPGFTFISAYGGFLKVIIGNAKVNTRQRNISQKNHVDWVGWTTEINKVRHILWHSSIGLWGSMSWKKFALLFLRFWSAWKQNYCNVCRHSSSTLFVQFNELGGACGIRMFLYLAGPKRDVYFACVSEGSRCKFVYNGSYWHIPSNHSLMFLKCVYVDQVWLSNNISEWIEKYLHFFLICEKESSKREVETWLRIA